MTNKLSQFLVLIRPYQWSKNLFVFFPLFFGGKITDIHLLNKTIFSFYIFSFIASSIYCYNDIIDCEADKKHSVKRHRPIANGSISIAEGYFTAFTCLLVSIILFYISDLPKHAIIILTIYFIINVVYCNFLKRYAIIDVFIIAFGFIMRICFGGIVTGIALSEWIIIMTFLLALFLAFTKRRDDVLIFEKTGKCPRRNTSSYSLMFIDQVLTMLATIIIISYIIYCISPEVTNRFNSKYIFLTAIYVLGGMIRYLQLSTIMNKTGSPTKIFLSDHVIHGCIAGWIITFSLIIYIF